MSSKKSKDELTERLQWAITAALSSPLLDDIQGFAWEAVFHFPKRLPIRDPLRDGKHKRLFDAVDRKTGCGWSLKAKQCSSKEMQCEAKIEFVIARADIYGKAVKLGYEGGLTRSSDAQAQGNAIVALWNSKVQEDMKYQSVTKPRLAVLLKSVDRHRYGFFETDLPELVASRMTWNWVGKGLQGTQDGRVTLRWHLGQQLFQTVFVPKDCKFFSVEPRRIPMDAFVQFIANLAYGQTLS